MLVVRFFVTQFTTCLCWWSHCPDFVRGDIISGHIAMFVLVARVVIGHIARWHICREHNVCDHILESYFSLWLGAMLFLILVCVTNWRTQKFSQIVQQ